jgi:hypothetical protein
MPFDIISATFSKVLDPCFVRFQFELNGRNGRVQMGDLVTAIFAPIKNPVTGEPESVRVQHGTGFIFKEAECVSAEEMRVKVGELSFSWPGKAGFVTQVNYSN